ncbi:uncharacterized protein LOC112639009 [Camponotus floridanus]|uniref:uncharacterized protein LOC112639009 n=1 Tax=Camponotus floridanus TaxID=104421 RepID=UPI00059EA9EB|nr:uncharacterized protein LOC112639009 [Camponotus floridanus]
MIMWRSSKKLIINCIQFVIRCGRINYDIEDLEDIPNYDVQDVPSNTALGAESIDITTPWHSLKLRRNIEHSNEEFNVFAVHFQPQMFGLPWQPWQNDLQHRPDAPGTRRTSPPEVVTKMLRALEEMGEPVEPLAIKKMRGNPSESL